MKFSKTLLRSLFAANCVFMGNLQLRAMNQDIEEPLYTSKEWATFKAIQNITAIVNQAVLSETVDPEAIPEVDTNTVLTESTYANIHELYKLGARQKFNYDTSEIIEELNAFGKNIGTTEASKERLEKFPLPNNNYVTKRGIFLYVENPQGKAPGIYLHTPWGKWVLRNKITQKQLKSVLEKITVSDPRTDPFNDVKIYSVFGVGNIKLPLPESTGYDKFGHISCMGMNLHDGCFLNDKKAYEKNLLLLESQEEEQVLAGSNIKPRRMALDALFDFAEKTAQWKAMMNDYNTMKIHSLKRLCMYFIDQNKDKVKIPIDMLPEELEEELNQ